jgi:urocanate hydratase
MRMINNPGTGVMRHTDADYQEAVQVAKEKGVKIQGVTLHKLNQK